MLAVVCAVMAALAAVVYWRSGIGRVVSVPAAALRGAAQLALIALVLTAALASLWSSALVLLVMFGVATFTATRRAQANAAGLWMAVPLAVGMAAVLPILLLSGVVPLKGIALVPIGGIILGNAMTATSQSARFALTALVERKGEVEAALSLGFGARAARVIVIRHPASEALLPGLDQTRTVGLVTLPGAFVGVLLASGSPTQAAAVQILVLAGIMLAQACAVATTIELAARGQLRRAETEGSAGSA